MHFVYKTGQSLSKYLGFGRKLICYTGTSFFKLITTPDFFCVQYAPFKATSSTFNPFWRHLLVFMHLQICFELIDPEIEKHYKWALKRLKLGMVSSFHPHSMCEKSRGLRQKLDALRVQTGQSLSKYQGFGRKLICYTGTSFFKLITTPDFFCVQYATFKATSSTFNPFWRHLLFFMHLQICFELIDPEIEKHYKWALKRLKLGMVSSFHPHSMCEKK